jgi:hypothetical protein
LTDSGVTAIIHVYERLAHLITSKSSQIAGGRLAVTGIVIDSVVKTTLINKDNLGNIAVYLSEWLTRYKTYRTGIRGFEAFIRVCLGEASSSANRSSTSRREFETSASAFYYLLMGMAAKDLSVNSINRLKRLVAGNVPQIAIRPASLSADEKEQHNIASQVIMEKFMVFDGHWIVETQAGFIGLAPEATLKGDLVGVLKGVFETSILRRDGRFFHHVGTCCIEGLAAGEAKRFAGVRNSNVRRLEII